MRRIVEMAYLHAWGPNGSADFRDEWRNAVKQLDLGGSFLYQGNGLFVWIEEGDGLVLN